MLDKYYTFSGGKIVGFQAVKFIRDYDDNSRKLESVTDTLAEIPEIRALRTSEKVQSSPKPDGIERMVILREELVTQQKELESYFNLYDKWMGKLSEDDKLYLEVMYQGYTNHPVEVLKRVFGLEQAQIYRNVNRALERLSGLATGK